MKGNEHHHLCVPICTNVSPARFLDEGEGEGLGGWCWILVHCHVAQED